jgi:hypothetical protein
VVLLFRFQANSCGGGWVGGRRSVLHWEVEVDQFRALYCAHSKRHWTLHSVTDSVIKLFKLSGNYTHHLLQQYISVPRYPYNL